jgi:hypothetical protein
MSTEFPWPSNAPLVDDDDDALPGIDVILGLDLPAIPRIRPLGV